MRIFDAKNLKWFTAVCIFFDVRFAKLMCKSDWKGLLKKLMCKSDWKGMFKKLICKSDWKGLLKKLMCKSDRKSLLKKLMCKSNRKGLFKKLMCKSGWQGLFKKLRDIKRDSERNRQREIQETKISKEIKWDQKKKKRN